MERPRPDRPAAAWLERVRRAVSRGPLTAPGRRILAWSLLALAMAAGLGIHAGGSAWPGLRSGEAVVRDTLERVLARGEPDPRIALVDLDEESLRRVGPWPWPRDRLADLVETLVSRHQARIVAFDLVLPEPARDSRQAGDERLAALGAQALLVPAQAFDYAVRERPVASGVPGGAVAGLDDIHAATASGYVGSYPALAAARCVGNVGFMPDFDGKLRQLPPLTMWQGERFPMLALAALLCAGGAGTPAAEGGALAVARRLQVSPGGQWRLRFARDPSAYLAVSAAAVLGSEEVPRVAGRIVLVGSSALGLSDRVATPLSSSSAGVTVHAQALSELLDLAEGREPVAPPPWLAPVWLLASTAFLWWAITGAQHLRWIGTALAIGLAGWAAVAAWTVHGGAAQPVTPALWSYAVLLLLLLPLEWSGAHAQVRARNRLLSRYVARPVLDEMLRSEGGDPLAPHHADISVLIADMQDYTRITAHSTFEEAASLTRDFLDCLTGPVLAHRGTLDKYTGDGLVAFWGAPLSTPDHASRALDAALAIKREVARYNDARRARGELPVRVRIGLATGRALVGELGTAFRNTYTAVGDVINLASRLQEAARDFDSDILASRAMAEACPDRRFRPLGVITVRGLAREEIFAPD